MPISIHVTRNRFPEIARQMRAEASKIVRETAFAIQGNIIAGMSASHSGRIYTRGNIVHQASAPGEMPAIDEGHLFGSIAVEANPGDTEAFVYTNVEYSPHLEFGTVTMQARPFMTPATEQERAGFEQRFRNLEGNLR